ncbi:MAG: hypothetical protein IJE11_03815 [Bacteroidales bacterium]|nr:hypothetical protein [Bacteroidales bacterium]
MNNDILKYSSDELKKMPYTVPEGYFEQVKAEISRSTAAEEGVSLWRKAVPYISVAATFLIMVSAGTFFLEKTTQQDGMTYEDYLVHSDMLIEAEYEQDTQIADATIAAEDIIEYLIYTGVTAEDIEQSK